MEYYCDMNVKQHKDVGHDGDKYVRPEDNHFLPGMFPISRDFKDQRDMMPKTNMTLKHIGYNFNLM